MYEQIKPVRKVPYGIANYAELIEKRCYFVDKTRYIVMLEGIENPLSASPAVRQVAAVLDAEVLLRSGLRRAF